MLQTASIRPFTHATLDPNNRQPGIKKKNPHSLSFSIHLLFDWIITERSDSQQTNRFSLLNFN